MSDLLVQTENNIRAQNLFQSQQFILVAVSGGLDSMVLLHVLTRLAHKFGWMPAVLHFNHQLRGTESDADEEFVRAEVAKLGLKFITERADVRQYAEDCKMSIEMAARQLRHGFFARASSTLGVHSLALAHHANDQVELFYLRVLRGAGGEGLAGMAWSNSSPANPKLELVRPFLNLFKRDLASYADQEKIPFRDDASNAQLDHDRNKIRHELIPLLQQKFQPSLTRTTLRLMQILGAESEFVRETARMWKRQGRPAFEDLHVAVQRQVILIDLLELGIAPEFGLIERLRRSADQVIMVNPTLTVWRNQKGSLQSRPVSSLAHRSEEFALELVGRHGTALFSGMKIDWELKPWQKCTHDIPRRSHGCEYFDADKIGVSICLRHWRPGDRFQPIGMGQSVKLQDLLTNLKVPRDRRRKLIVAATAQDEIFWVEDLRISERFKLTETTESTLKWEWKRK